jgi:precorrin-6B methylase 2
MTEGRLPGKWDAMRPGLFPESVREKAFAVARVTPAGRAADIGAGTGFVTEGLLRRGVRVVAVDQSPT